MRMQELCSGHLIPQISLVKSICGCKKNVGRVRLCMDKLGGCIKLEASTPNAHFAMLDLLFTYGTLCSEFDNEAAKRLHVESELVGRGKWAGRLFLVMNQYPAAVESKQEHQWVYGELRRLRQPQATLSFLDAYEQCLESDPKPHEYERKISAVHCGHTVLSAWVYVYQWPHEQLQAIASGIFFKPPNHPLELQRAKQH